MTRSRTGPSFGKLMIMMGLLIGSVIVYRTMSSTQLDTVSKESHNRVVYEQLYAEASDEVAYWRQRYDQEFARAEQLQKSLSEAESKPLRLQEEVENYKAEVARLKETLTKKETV